MTKNRYLVGISHSDSEIIINVDNRRIKGIDGVFFNYITVKDLNEGVIVWTMTIVGRPVVLDEEN